jgi:hypothetical protein
MGWTGLTLTVRTPMFLGLDGARMERLDANTEVAFPVSSLRGALRHWLRALVGAEVGNNLGRLAAIESAVFGAAADRNRPATQGGPGPSRVAIQALPPALRYTTAGSVHDTDWLRRPGGARGESQPNPIGYLLGQGMFDAVQGRLRRPFVAPEVTVKLRARVRDNADGALADLFWCSVWALRTFGGLGARTRRGFGTLSVAVAPGIDLGGAGFNRAWLDRNSDDDLDAVIACARAAVRIVETTVNGANGRADAATGAARSNQPDRPLRKDGSAKPTPGDVARRASAPQADTPDYPTYPAFLPGAYLTMDEPLTTSPAAGLSDALAATGERLRDFRTNADGDPNASTREWETILRPWLDDDDRSGPGDPFELGALGLPVVFSQKGREGGKADTRVVTVAPNGAKIDRRASPLWLRVYPDDAGHWRLRSLALLSEWLPHDAQLTAKTKGRHPKQLTKPTQDEVNTVLRYWFE